MDILGEQDDQKGFEEQTLDIPEEILAMIKDAKAEAAEIIANAEKQAASIRDMANQEQQAMQEQMQVKAQEVYENAESEGFRTGYDHGQQAGMESAHAEYMATLNNANQILQDAIVYKQQEIYDAQNVIVDLAYAIARKVILNNPQILKEQIVEVVVLALKKIRDTEKVEIQVHPDDFAQVQQALPVFKNILAGKADITIQAEPHIEAGGAQLHTNMGTIDAKVTTQFDEIRKALQSLDLGREDLGDT